jgi:hypothetical protein
MSITHTYNIEKLKTNFDPRPYFDFTPIDPSNYLTRFSQITKPSPIP